MTIAACTSTWPIDELKDKVPEWTIEKCTMDDSEGVYDLLNRAFFKYEPLTCDIPEQFPMEELYALKLLAQGHSYKAVLPSGRIVGVIINASFQNLPDDEPPAPGRISKVVELFEYVDKQVELDEEGLLDIFIIVVDPEFRRQGLAKELGRVTVKHAETAGYRGTKISCTSKYSADTAVALGFTLVHSMAYADYKDGEGKPIFKPALPHTHINIYVKEFASNSNKPQQ